MLCALYPLLLAYRAWRIAKLPLAPVTRQLALASLARSCTLAACLCCLPLVLWLWQYLFVDLSSIAQLTRDEVQYLLTTQQFGYTMVGPLAPITDPLTFDPLTLHGRVILLLDQLGVGSFLPVLCTVSLLAVRRLFARHAAPLLALWGWRWAAAAVGALLLVIVFGRAPLAFVCTYQAQHALNSGDYTEAYNWLGYASQLNPALDQLSSYHIERGQTWYFSHPGQDTIETYAYLAASYDQQKDYLSAFQELSRAWQYGEHTPWLVDEMNVTLIQLTSLSLPLEGGPAQRLTNDNPALPWLDQMLATDPGNVYAQYMLGRVQYDLHNYTQCTAAMHRVIALSQNTDILSSAYTYLALSSAGQGDYVDARSLLLHAVAIDPKYRNNTAREELSGLR